MPTETRVNVTNPTITSNTPRPPRQAPAPAERYRRAEQGQGRQGRDGSQSRAGQDERASLGWVGAGEFGRLEQKPSWLRHRSGDTGSVEGRPHGILFRNFFDPRITPLLQAAVYCKSSLRTYPDRIRSVVL